MKDLKLDSNGEILIEDGDLQIVDGFEQKAQGCNIRLRWWKGEWFLDRRIGVDYRGRVFGKGIDPTVRDAEIQRNILAGEGIERFTEYVSQVGADRTLEVSYTVSSSEGEISRNERIG